MSVRADRRRQHRTCRWRCGAQLAGASLAVAQSMPSMARPSLGVRSEGSQTSLAERPISLSGLSIDEAGEDLVKRRSEWRLIVLPSPPRSAAWRTIVRRAGRGSGPGGDRVPCHRRSTGQRLGRSGANGARPKADVRWRFCLTARASEYRRCGAQDRGGGSQQVARIGRGSEGISPELRKDVRDSSLWCARRLQERVSPGRETSVLSVSVIAR